MLTKKPTHIFNRNVNVTKGEQTKINENQKTFTLILAILFLIFLGSCDKDEFLESKNGFPETATNLSLFNSKYDDYNSALEPGEYDMYAFVFSSNRKSNGIVIKYEDISNDMMIFSSNREG